MTSRTTFSSSAVIFGLMLIGSAAVYAGGDDGDAAEHRSFSAAKVRLTSAVSAAEEHTGARAMSAEFKKEDGVYIFEVELLTVNGEELEVLVDASTGAVLQVETEEDEVHDND